MQPMLSIINKRFRYSSPSLKKITSVDYAVNATREWNTKPAAEKTFEVYYNIFSSSYNKRLAMQSNTRSTRISSMPEGGRGGRGGRG